MDPYARTFIVRWADCDANGHMRNTAYSEYATEVRIAYLAGKGFTWEKFLASKLGPVLLHEYIDYMREVRMGESVVVDFSVIGLSPDGARFRFEQNVWLPNRKKAARLVIAGGWMDLELRKLRLPPDELLRVLNEAPRGEPFEEMKPVRRR
ncbi:MAG TPA: acyl-CoA thioesterase [Anaeromyxobacter sp.]